MTTYDPAIQDILTRRVYIVRAKEELIERLSSHFNTDDLNEISRPQVVMTEELYFEKHLEGWRRKILEKCKESFLKDELEYGLLDEIVDLEKVLGQTSDLQKCFDQWWVAEEAADYIEIETDWHLSG
ncbi:hypothetical protein H0A36_26370 [Endozoicomonas sp. SM1973]|uniref:Uncharacterized protein n=1 Tax=Spartinivicinus marinus TaxID=2994442 RepID=A0A853INV8_9GAMM|nr:hypothetical protein [Spartinivicinus marinus]MCX4030342.1 hypothetical protein [Spartinivicinus marinus]NYZ69546.1 hypothetical protein [Spartinivicinus marinus]